MKTKLLGEESIPVAVEILAGSGIVAIPTETVYGLGADCKKEEAVEAIYRAKGRPETKALSVLVTDMTMVEGLCKDIPPVAYKLAEAFWPGPLTMILPSKNVVAKSVTAGGNTLGVRAPQHAVTLAIIGALGSGLAAPSANISGEESPKTAVDVLSQLEGRIDAVVDGGRCTLSVESTILDLCQNPPKILRQGSLSAEKIWDLLEKEG